MGVDCLELLKQVGELFAALLGERAEVVIHDMESAQIVWIRNGSVTGRTVGRTEHNATIRFIEEQSARSDKTHYLAGYKSNVKNGKTLKSSNLFVKDENGELRYTMCINQDISQLEVMQGLLAQMTGTVSLTASVGEQEQTVEAITMRIILDEMERAKPFSLDSREAKLSILKRLEEKGVFDVRHAVPKVCELLQIAQATLYKYLKEIKDETQ